nr:ankyrin repeat-containing protein itn1 [Quercus suber]
MFQARDKDKNNVLHLAAKLEEHQSWLIPGAALQMQSEIKWYELVKSTVPKYLLYQTDNDSKTPADIFTESHKNLVKEGGEWLNKTSESCSVVAALIATVAFATSTTVPGGVKANSGTPIPESHPAFDIFVVTSLVALCFSVIALFLFLSILPSRYQEKDFRVDLPGKLLLGLTSLFVSNCRDVNIFLCWTFLCAQG